MVSQDLQDRRAYLGSYADRYFELLPSGGYQQLPIAPGVVFTENGQRLRLGQGLWATATSAARTRAVTEGVPPEVVEAAMKSIPRGKMCAPEDMAAVIRFLASEDAIGVVGQNIIVSGGRCMQ